jgi:ribose/xylose/arabinose/galactoside ABC-type transport system permease subunit
VAGIWFAERVNDGTSIGLAAVNAIVICLVLGLVLGAFVGLTGVPAWAASLGAFALVQAYLVNHTGAAQLVPAPTAAVTSGFVWWLLFAMVSVVGAAALASPTVRARLVLAGSTFSRARLINALIGLGGSSAAAGLAGVLLARRMAAGQATVPFELLLLALGVALIAGISVYGGQGPIFGVVLASGIAAAITHWNALAGRAAWSQLVLAGVLILVGLLVSWVISLLARRLSA